MNDLIDGEAMQDSRLTRWEASDTSGAWKNGLGLRASKPGDLDDKMCKGRSIILEKQAEHKYKKKYKNKRTQKIHAKGDDRYTRKDRFKYVPGMMAEIETALADSTHISGKTRFNEKRIHPDWRIANPDIVAKMKRENTEIYKLLMIDVDEPMPWDCFVDSLDRMCDSLELPRFNIFGNPYFKDPKTNDLVQKYDERGRLLYKFQAQIYIHDGDKPLLNRKFNSKFVLLFRDAFHSKFGIEVDQNCSSITECMRNTHSTVMPLFKSRCPDNELDWTDYIYAMFGKDDAAREDCKNWPIYKFVDGNFSWFDTDGNKKPTGRKKLAVEKDREFDMDLKMNNNYLDTTVSRDAYVFRNIPRKVVEWARAKNHPKNTPIPDSDFWNILVELNREATLKTHNGRSQGALSDDELRHQLNYAKNNGYTPAIYENMLPDKTTFEVKNAIRTLKKFLRTVIATGVNDGAGLHLDSDSALKNSLINAIPSLNSSTLFVDLGNGVKSNSVRSMKSKWHRFGLDWEEELDYALNLLREKGHGLDTIVSVTHAVKRKIASGDLKGEWNSDLFSYLNSIMKKQLKNEMVFNVFKSKEETDSSTTTSATPTSSYKTIYSGCGEEDRREFEKKLKAVKSWFDPDSETYNQVLHRKLKVEMGKDWCSKDEFRGKVYGDLFMASGYGSKSEFFKPVFDYIVDKMCGVVFAA